MSVNNYRQSKLKCIHYGSDQYDPEKFKSPVQKYTGYIKSKPTVGGLWASPVGATPTWDGWLSRHFGELIDIPSFEFEYAGNTLVIDRLDDASSLQWIDGEWLDYYWLINNGYDAIHLTHRGVNDNFALRPRSFYGWGCESLLVLNKDCITTT